MSKEESMLNKQKEEPKMNKRTRNKLIRKARIADGYCPKCVEREKAPDRSLCLECLADMNERITKLRSERAEMGLCPRCGEVNDTDNYACRECHEKYTTPGKKSPAKQRGEKDEESNIQAT